MSRSQFIFSLRSRWKLIDVKVAEENVIVWSDRADYLQSSSSSAAAVVVPAHVNVHVDSKADKIAKTIERIRNSRQEMESNRDGIVIDPITFDGNDDAQSGGGGVLRIGELASQTVRIRNTSYMDVHCMVKDSVARQRGIRIEGEKDFVLCALSSEWITVSFTPKTFGIEKSIIVFEFTSANDDDDIDSEDYYGSTIATGAVKQFTITRYITIRSGDPDDYDIIKPTAPYVKKQPQRGDGNKFVNPVKVTGRSTNSAVVPFRNKLGKYPMLLKRDLHSDTVKEFMNELYGGGGHRGERRDDIDYSSLLTIANYSDCMKYLLWFEELQMQKDITTYDLENALLRRDGRRYYTLRVPGLAENRPSVLKGDRIIISVSGRGKFEGVVQRTTNEDAIIEFAPSFYRVFIDGLRVDVRFTFSRTTLRTSHQALAAVKERKDLFHKILFPEMLNMENNPPMTPLNLRVIRSSQLTYYNRTLNQEQESAVVGILQSMARTAPYLIYGPPGTGKTVTLVESILQTMSARGSDPNTKILICAPSNTATDVVVERLAPYVSPREMIRIMAFSREKRAVPDSVMSYTNYDEETDSFVMPEVEELMNYKIVAVTISYGGRLFNNGIQNHFTHVFMDEAGHEIEASAIGCLASVTKYSHSSPPVIVLAGDPQQLGPIIRSDIGKNFGLEKSLLERCSERECYSRSEECDDLGYHYDKRMVTKLVRNYRSHPRILQLPNEAFYNGDLIAAADITRSHRFVNWEHLPRRRFPILFHGCEGEDTREANSPSWFNPDEVQYVKMYVDLLVKDTRQNRCKPEDIGIITPYHKQAQKIRMLLKAHDYDCKVGSVEEFQGSERPVIIISTVRSTVDYIRLDLKHKLGFLANKKRFNVAVTRAQALLIVIGNPFTLENDPNWKSMIDYCIDGGGYTGVDYVKMEDRDESGTAIDEVISGMQSINLDEDDSIDDDDFLLVSHVTAQEGPAWRAEE